MVLNDGKFFVWHLLKGRYVVRETKDGSLEEALDFAHVVFKCVFVFVNKASPF